jgi:hypothetical protein
VKKEKKKISHPSMTIHTPIEMPCRMIKDMLFLKIFTALSGPKIQKTSKNTKKSTF